jgi:hypothetical protein
MALNPLLKKLVSQSAQKYKGGHSKLAKLKEGRNVIRLIAPPAGTVDWVKVEDGMFYRELGVHWIKPDMNAKPIAVVGSEEICYQRVSALASAIDMAIASAHDEDSKKLYEEWKARKSIILNVVSRDNNNEVQILELTPTTFGKIMDLVNLYDDSGVDVLDHASGLDIVITKTGKGLNTTYDVAAVPLAPGKTFQPVSQQQVDAAENLDTFIEANYFRGDEQKALNAVVQFSGISMPRLGAPATPVAALTSTAATVADAPVAASVAPAAEPAPVAQVAAAPAAMTIEQMQAEIARQQAAQAAVAAQQAAAAAQATPTPTPAPADPVSSAGNLSQDETDALLAELNTIGNS